MSNTLQTILNKSKNGENKEVVKIWVQIEEKIHLYELWGIPYKIGKNDTLKY